MVSALALLGTVPPIGVFFPGEDHLSYSQLFLLPKVLWVRFWPHELFSVHVNISFGHVLGAFFI